MKRRGWYSRTVTGIVTAWGIALGVGPEIRNGHFVFLLIFYCSIAAAAIAVLWLWGLWSVPSWRQINRRLDNRNLDLAPTPIRETQNLKAEGQSHNVGDRPHYRT
jgi:hypothetical protein